MSDHSGYQGPNMDVRENERLAALETGHMRLERDVEVLTSSIRQLADDVRSDMGRLMQRMNESSKTPWSTLAGWAAVIIAVMSFVGSNYIRDLGRQEGRQDKLETAFLEHLLTDGHAPVVSRVESIAKALDKVEAANTEQIAKMDETLQREMRILDDRLQGEMRLLVQLDDPRIQSLEKEVGILREHIRDIERVKMLNNPNSGMIQ